jgi:periplasmic protein TonB
MQAKYQTPPSLPDDLKYAVMCEPLLHEQGRVLQYRLHNSSGSLLFGQSDLEALSKFTKSRLPLKARLEPWSSSSSLRSG